MNAPIVIYAAESAGWAALGFLAGYLAGHAARDAHQPAATTAQDGPAMPLNRRHLRVPVQALLGIVVLALGVLTVVQGIAQDRATQRLTACLTRYSNQFADTITARQRSAREAQAALDELIIARRDHLNGGPQFQAAITTYLSRRNVQRLDQRTHPFPPAPRDCPRS